jgi:phage tail-like protein
MDANGTRFKLLLGMDDWGRCLEATEHQDPDGGVAGGTLASTWARSGAGSGATSWDSDRSELTLARSTWRFPVTEGERSLEQAARRGAAMDRYGNWYWIDTQASGILVTSSGSGATTPFWPAAGGGASPAPAAASFGPVRVPAAPAPHRLRGLTVTDDHYLVVGTLDPGGLLVFDLRSGGPPWHAAWPEDLGFAPLDIAARPDGGVFVLDAPSGAGRRIWRLDRHLMVEPVGPAEPRPEEPATFGPVGSAGQPAGAATAPRGSGGAISAGDAAPLDGDPVAIGVAGPDRVVVLDRHGVAGRPAVRVFNAALAEQPGSPHDLGGLDGRYIAHAMAVVPRDDGVARGPGGPDTEVVADVHLVDTQGDQALHFLLGEGSAALELVPDYEPMRLFGGRGLVATPLGPWYDCVDRWVPLVAQRRPQFADVAEVHTPVFDSGLQACTWHRLMLDACIPPETSVQVWSASSDDRRDLDHPAWTPEPAPYRRGDGSERPFPVWRGDARYGTFELLFQAAQGRYLAVKLELRGNRRESPRLRALRAYYPRFSYLAEYLPHAYREDAASARFLDGFLANLEGFYTSIEDRIAMAEILFDGRSTPREALDWLASWFDAVMDPGWDEDRRRLFVRHAVELFRLRGTERGIRIALGLALLPCPDERLFAPDAEREPGGIRIVERYQAARWGTAVAGDPTRATLPRETGAAMRWTPGQGAAVLHRRYAAYLRALVAAGRIAASTATELRYPVTDPGGDRTAAWRAFSAGAIGFVPTATGDDAGRWQRFLARRHVSVAAFNEAHRLLGSGAVGAFSEVALPSTLPGDGAALADWFTFESTVLPSVRAAHRFTVLMPVPVGRATRGRVVRASDARDRRAEEDRMARLVALERPAHTVFDIRSYWLAFRVGEARLGRDTLLDLGSRSPDLRPPAVLGSLHLGESVLTSAMADVPDRSTVFSGSVDAATRRVARRTDG